MPTLSPSHCLPGGHLEGVIGTKLIILIMIVLPLGLLRLVSEIGIIYFLLTNFGKETANLSGTG